MKSILIALALVAGLSACDDQKTVTNTTSVENTANGVEVTTEIVNEE